jgi:hypothetical protein
VRVFRRSSLRKTHLYHRLLGHIINGKVAGLPPLPVARIGRRVIIRREALVKWLWIVEGRNGIMPVDLNSSLETHGKE